MARTWLSAILLTFSVSLVACSGSSDDAPADGGSSDSAAVTTKTSFVGNWQVDKEAMKELMTKSMMADDEVPEADKEMMLEMVPGMIDNMVMDLTLAEDGTFQVTTAMMGQSDSVVGAWVLADGVITMTESESEEPPATATISGDQLTITFPAEEGDGDEIIMVRAE